MVALSQGMARTSDLTVGRAHPSYADSLSKVKVGSSTLQTTSYVYFSIY